MHPQLIEVMRGEVSTIYRAATGEVLNEAAFAPAEATVGAESAAPFEEVARSFAELEALARTIPALAERIPPFSFSPPLNAVLAGDNLIIEVAVPGIAREDVTVECGERMLIISGIRRAGHGAEQGTYSHGEIPWGPFYRSVDVPFAVHGEPDVDLDRGLLRVRLKSSPEQQPEEATARPSQ